MDITAVIGTLILVVVLFVTWFGQERALGEN
jgi:HAMP domain-containing protein